MKLHYRKLGSGQPLVILHGLFGSSDNWQTLGRRFAENYEVWLVDQRNHGHSPHSEEFSYELMAADLEELIQEHNLQNVQLVGHSMGGKTAMHYAASEPDALEKLIIVDMGLKEYPSHHDQILAGLNAIDLDTVKSRGEADKIISGYVEDWGVKQFLLKNLYWVEKGQLGWRINLKVLEREMPEILSAMTDELVMTPTLFIRGEKSNYILDDDFFDIRQQFPHSMIETVEGAGHWVHAEAPEEFYKLVNDFLS